MANNLFHIIASLDAELTVPADGKTSQVIFQDEDLTAVLFGFAPGAGLTEHTAPMPVILYFVRGIARVSLADTQTEATQGTWVHLAPGLPHSILASSETVMLLLMLKCGKPVPSKLGSEDSNEASN